MSVRIEGGNQNLDYIEHIREGKHTLRITIHDDSSASQAYGVVDRWDGTRWHNVVRIAGTDLLLEHGLGYRQPRPDASAFKRDRDRLMGLAKEVL